MRTKEILDYYGTEHQIIKAMEELGELQTALAKWVNGDRKKEAVITEIADVKIMADQMAWCFGKQEVDEEIWRKLERQGDRIEADRTESEREDI